MGILQKVQIGQEASVGVEEDATTILRAPFAALDDMGEAQIVEEDIGILGGSDRSIIPYKWGQMAIPQHPASFEQLVYYLSGIEKQASGTQDGTSGDAYIYTYDVPYNAAGTYQTYTVEGGDSQQEEQMLYAFFQQLQLSGEGEGPLQVQGTMVGQTVATGSFTAGVSVPTVEDILFSKGELYLDAISGTVGSTQVSNSLLSFELTVENILLVKQSIDGALTWDIIHRGPVDISGSLTFEHDSNAVSEVANMRAETPQLMQLKWEGSSFDNAGDTYSVRTFIVNLPVKYTKVNTLEVDDNLTTRSIDFVSKYNATAGDRGQFLVVNDLSAPT